MVMTVSRMKKFIRVSFATAWDAQWYPMIFLTPFRKLSKNQNVLSFFGYTGNSISPVNHFGICLVVIGQSGGFSQWLGFEGSTPEDHKPITNNQTRSHDPKR